MAEYMMTPEDITELASKMAAVGDELLEIFSKLAEWLDRKDNTAYYDYPEIMLRMRNMGVKACIYRERMGDVCWACKELDRGIGEECRWWVKEAADDA